MKKNQFMPPFFSIYFTLFFLLLASCNSSLHNNTNLLPQNKTNSLTTLSFSEVTIQNNNLKFNLSLSKVTPLTINFYIVLENQDGDAIALTNAMVNCKMLNYNSNFLNCDKHQQLYKWIFTAGKHTATINIPLQSHNLDESFRLKVITFNPFIAQENTENLIIGHNTLFLENSLVTTPSTLNVLENYSSLSVPLQLTTNRSFSIKYKTQNITAETLYLLTNTRTIATKGVDFTAISGELIISPEKGSQKINIDILDDTVYEGSQSFVLILESTEPIFNGHRRKNILINIDDDEDSPYLKISDFIAQEQRSTQQWPVTLSWASEKPLSFQYELHSNWLNNAEENKDYVKKRDVVNFPPLTTSQFIPINIIEDSFSEDTESFSLSIESLNALQLINHTNTYTAFINDTSEGVIPSIQFSTHQLNAHKGHNINIPIELIGPATTPVKVYYRSVSKTAITSKDFEDKAGVLYFPVSTTNQVQYINIKIFDNHSVNLQQTKSFYLYIEKVHNGKISTNRTISIQIL